MCFRIFIADAGRLKFYANANCTFQSFISVESLKRNHKTPCECYERRVSCLVKLSDSLWWRNIHRLCCHTCSAYVQTNERTEHKEFVEYSDKIREKTKRMYCTCTIVKTKTAFILSSRSSVLQKRRNEEMLRVISILK